MSRILNSIQGILSQAVNVSQNMFNTILPPEKRAESFAKLRAWAISNPKTAAFLAAQLAFTGLPLLLFLAFTITVFTFSLITALLIGLMAVFLFTVFMAGLALLVFLPTVFLTTFAATFIYLWGLGGYVVLAWFNESKPPAREGTAIGDRINYWTGGKTSRLIDETGKKEEGGNTTSGAQDERKHVNTEKEQTINQVNGVQKQFNQGTNEITKTPDTARTG